jgi:F-type H+-transporting ATPase subunit c
MVMVFASRFVLTFFAMLLLAPELLAQEAAKAPNTGMGLGMGLSAIGAGLGVGLIGYGVATGIARQPEADGKIKSVFLLAFLVEGAAIIGILFSLISGLL